ncbi:hypothetical protein M758_3G137000 [Ceratodon purpureus]|nr:hypothetical protein M758_3G137000 [Ceratodon purpureus]
MAGDKAVVAKAREVERDIVLKAKVEALHMEYSNVSSPKVPSSASDTPRASSVATPKGSVKSSARSTPAPRKYVSPMARAREEKKRREAGESNKSKDWPCLSDMESSSNPSTSGSLHSDMSTTKPANLPKFGEWDKHSVNSGPCYSILFQNAAQEKKIGGPVRIHSTQPNSPPRTQDLYQALPPATTKSTKKPKSKKKKQSSIFCCFSS